MSRAELAEAFPHEGSLIEFKAGAGDRPLQETAVAFSNADGGVILIGVADDGSPVAGRPADAGTSDAVHQALANAHDLGRYDINALDVDGSAVTVVAIARRREGFAQTSNGRVLVRHGTRDQALFGVDLQRFLNERSHVRFESTRLDATLQDVDPALLRQLAEAFGWTHDVESRLVEAGLASDGHLTVAGALYLINDPSRLLGKANVEILRFPSDMGSEYDRREVVGGPLDVQLSQTVRRLSDDLGTELVVLGVRRYELPRIPEVVLRECIANALAHRTYEAHGTPVRIELRPSFISVASPGGLPEPVTVRNIREANAARNLNAIKVLRRFGLAEDVGRGVDVMQDTMRQELLEQPEFRDHGRAVEVILPIRTPVAPMERAWVRELETRGQLTGSDRIVLVHAARGVALTNAVVRKLAQVDSQDARAVLQRLRDQGFLVQQGQRGGASYQLAGSLHPPAGLRMSAEELDRLVEELAANGPIRNADVRDATGLDRIASLRILERLVSSGRLVRRGERRGTTYERARPTSV